MLLGCGRKSGESSWSRALPDGTYDVSAPLCGSTGAAPEYPSVNYRVALFDFEGLVEHALTIDHLSVKEVFKASDCLVTVERSIYQNYDGVFSTRHDRKFTFEPVDCTMAATAQGTVFRVGPAYTDLMKDSTDRTEELPFQVATDDDHTYSLTSADYQDLNDLWGSYGCAKPDRLKTQFVVRPISN